MSDKNQPYYRIDAEMTDATKEWLKVLGEFSVTYRGDCIKGMLCHEVDEDGDCYGQAYLDPTDCDALAAALVEVAALMRKHGERR